MQNGKTLYESHYGSARLNHLMLFLEVTTN